MLDQETKKRIDDLRNTLVGKVPDPKAQVEQITFALIYKFMDDMDNASIEAGGVASFFVKEYEKYSWKKLFDSKLGGADLVNIYSDSIIKMNSNPHLPPIFRDIFKNAGINYRDPETLRLFIKKINQFEYTNSEKLGDAYEYLLSVLGSQGNAGQFRTPRNIIDFIVKVVDPKKNETVLDPACGTSGFLIASYKHIIESNKNKNGKNNLKPDERKELINNIYGYDLDPEMVRMSIVNMYLHNFTDPKIYEYDSLTSEDRWNEYFDVVVANPPFMTPSGGIRPHKRFSVNSTRSEILFIDYIIEHLTPNGRGGIIVPAGIIFDDDSAYKKIRKRLIDQALIGVISLPKGVFLPYSGVKTSILILDKKKNKKNDFIYFLDIQNDGFSLNNSRKKTEKNDLPTAITNIKNNQFKTIPKAKILKNDEISLVFSKYEEKKEEKNLKFKREKINNLVDIFSGSRQKGGSLEKGIPSIGGSQIGKDGKILSNKMVYVSEEHFNSMKKGHLKNGDVLIVKDGATTGKMGLYKGNFAQAAINEHVFALRTKENICYKFLYYLMRGDDFQKKLQPFIQGIIGGINLKFTNLELPLPPKEVQNHIVEELEGYQKIIDASRQILQNYKPTIDIDLKWESVELGDLFELAYGKGLKSEDRISGNYNVYGSNGVVGTHTEYLTEGPFIIVGRKGSAGELHYSENNGYPIDTAFFISKNQLKKEINLEFVYYLLRNINLTSFDDQSAVPGINRNNVYKIKTNIPPIKIQEEIVTGIKKEVNYLKINEEMIKVFNNKINKKINTMWSK